MANPELRKTILIGLGGAGQLILTHVKRFFLDTYNVLPPCIKLLALDTDAARQTLLSNAHDQDIKLDDHEFFHLRVAQARQFVESDPEVRRWYIGDVTVAALESGAGAIRQNGRLALFYHVVKVKQRIESLVSQLNELVLPDRMRTARAGMGATTDFQLSDKAPEIYVCGSLAGGTGSGIFLDLGILLRHIMPTAITHGFFLLHWPYRNKAFAHRVRGNVYAALAELDNMQSITYGTRGTIPYTVKYADLTITVKDPPYSLFHIIDGRNERGESIDDVGAICETVANAIFLSTSALSYPLASVTDNLLALIGAASPKVWEGRNPRYSSLGVSAICYPAQELQRLLIAVNALGLCRAAIADVEGGMLATTAIPDATAIRNNVQAYFTDANLTREVIHGKILPNVGNITFQVDSFEVTDPTLLQPKADGEERQLLSQLAEAFKTSGMRYIGATRDALAVKLGDLERNEKLTTAYRRQWVDQAIQMVRELDHEAASQLNEATARVNEQRQTCRELLEIIMKSRHWPWPWPPSPRMRAAARWAGAVTDFLEAVRRKTIFEYERQLYDALIRVLAERRAAAPLTAVEVVTALRNASEVLTQRATLEDRNLRKLKATPTVTLVGEGDVVIVPHDKDPFCSRDSVRLSYEEFKDENGIHTMDGYLRIDREHPKKLPGFFRDHCQRKLRDLTSTTVHQAIETVGRHRENLEGYVTELMDDLFRKAVPLWHFHRSRMTPLQSAEYENVVNLGVVDSEVAQATYGSVVAALKAKYQFPRDHSYSASGDPYRIVLLNFAAALPVYFLQNLDEGRDRYEEEISPTYHIDSVFEMNVPDLFPVTDIENRTLRVLGMAIVNGIDVIRDEKLPKGHKFICELDEVKAANFGEPKIWFLFRDMLAEVKGTYNQKDSDNLLNLLTKALKAKVASMPVEQLRRSIQAHISRFETKLAQRDFSRLKSARLTYRETKELKDFLEPRGYAMDIDRYIAGR